MRFFVEEYGKILLAVFVATCVIMGVLSMFVSLWNENGGVEDGPKTNFQTNEEKRSAPVLEIMDFKTKTGQKVSFTEYIRALDYEGTDLSHVIEVESEGKYESVQSQYWTDKRLQPGVYRLGVKVKSPITGKEAKGTVLVLAEA